MGVYQVKFYGPLPQLKGQVYRGDSGGAWVINDEIIALSKQTICKKWDNLQVKKVETLAPFTDISEYFAQCDAIISQAPSLKPTDEDFLHYCATSIWSCRSWIESTLMKTMAELDK